MILVVDDDDGVRELAAEMLTDAGYRVVEARNGEEGLTAIKANPDIRLLFTDIVMPGAIDGWELAKRAKEIRPHLRVLYTSAFTPNMDDSDRGLGPLLPKPWRPKQLCDHVRAALMS